MIATLFVILAFSQLVLLVEAGNDHTKFQASLLLTAFVANLAALLVLVGLAK